MADNKNQHFVPQFYLRKFSTDEKSIDLFNLARNIAVANAPIRNQCSRDYWHGDPDPIFEEFVKRVEGLGAAAIKATILSDKVQDLRTLKSFVMFQLGRTVFMTEAHTESHEKSHRLAYGNPPEKKPVELGPKLCIHVHLMNEPILRDMAACLVVNKTDIDFITSDNPVALCNWWFHHVYRKRPGPGVGLAQAGLEIYLPLSPKHQLILYDGNLWSIPKAKAGTVVLKRGQDVLALNERQVLNAQHNIYFAPSKQTIEHVVYLAKECADRREKEKINFIEWLQSKGREYVGPGSLDDTSKVREKVISVSHNEIKPARRVTLFSKHFWPRYDDDASVVGALRDVAWTEIMQNFREALMKNRNMKLDDLDDYAAAHPLFHEVKAWKHEYWEERHAG